ncbi:MAG: hypothetical protein RRA32_02470 [bacterium]|nr:hypothetical protein [bacterium]
MTRRSWYLDFSASTPPADPEVPTKRAFLADFGYGSPLPAAGRLRNTESGRIRIPCVAAKSLVRHARQLLARLDSRRIHVQRAGLDVIVLQCPLQKLAVHPVQTGQTPVHPHPAQPAANSVR